LSAVADIRIGTVLAGYRVEERIGRGGMSVVYRADHLRLKRNVALKLLAPELAEDESFRERFLRESELAASLDHPNVVPIYDAGEAEGLLFIAMRYVEGTDLKALLRKEGVLSPERAIGFAGQLAGALDAAHERSLVHRDVKPSNVLLAGRAGKEHCYLSDFGLSTSASDRNVPADARHMVGTIDYVSPEQIRGDEVSGAADVYSLACLLYECLTGRVPFEGKTDVAVVFAHLEESPPNAGLADELDAVLERGMAKDPERRWETAGALAAGARAALGQAPGKQPREAWVKRRLLPIGAAAGVAAAAVAIAVTGLSGGGGTGIAQADSLVRIDPHGGGIAGAAALGGRPTAVTVCAGNVWVTSSEGTVSEVDPSSESVRRIPVRGRPGDVANVGDLVAVVSGSPRAVTMVDAEFGTPAAPVSLPGRPSSTGTAVAFGRDVWIANPGARELARLEPPYTNVADTVRLGGRPSLVAAGENALWAAGDRTLWRVDMSSGRAPRSSRLPFVPAALAAGAGGVWLVDKAGHALVRVDPVKQTIVARIPVGRGPRAVAVGADSVWVADGTDATVSKVDPARNAVVQTVDVRSAPVDIAVGIGAVWVVRRTES
jgi:tRNA A-37 threonylcarbamoyl transferase component Bud32